MYHSFAKSDRFTTQGHDHQPPVFFLPGWGFDGRIIEVGRPAFPWLFPSVFLHPQTFVEDLFVFLEKHDMNQIRLIGWSMGALLALDFARRYPEMVMSLDLISMRHHWPGDDIEQIRSDLESDMEGCLKSFYRKCFVSHKKLYSEFVSSLQSAYLKKADRHLLLAGLNYLHTSIPHPVPGIATTLIHGRKDIIAPVEEMAVMPQATIEILKHAGHLPFLARACSLRKKQQKELVCLKFSRAAETYDEYATVQKDLAEKLSGNLSRLPEFFPQAQILEIGCGTGGYTGLLAEKFPHAEITALDFSSSMLAVAKEKLTDCQNIQFVMADGEQFLEEARKKNGLAYDLITSNATLQWFSDLEQLFSNVACLLKPGGLLLCSLFGPGSLHELGAGVSQVFDRDVTVAAAGFPPKEELLDSIKKKFSASEVYRQEIVRHYPSVIALLRQLQKTGTTGVHSHTNLLFTHSRLTRLDDWFADVHGGCRITYEVFILQCVK